MAAVIDVPSEDTQKYGILDIESEQEALVKARGLVEKPAPAEAPSTLSITGRYILEPDIFNQLETQQRGAGGEIQLTDAMSAMIPHTPFYGYRFEGTRFDCGNKAGYVEANLAFALAREDIGTQMRAVLEKYQ